MTEQEERIIKVAKHCLLNDGICSECPDRKESAIECGRMTDEFFCFAENAIAQRDALLADLKLVCTQNNPCLVCSHYCPERNGMQKCELNDWVCNWGWRGEHHG